MAEEKYRRERRDRAPMSVAARVMMVLSVVQIVAGLFLHIGNEQILPLGLVFCVSIPFVAVAIIAAFWWPHSLAFRNAVRITPYVLTAIVTALWMYGAIKDLALNPGTTFMYHVEYYAAMVVVPLIQLLLLFCLPVFVSAASYGAMIDRILLAVTALLNAACEAFIVFRMTAEWGLDMSIDNIAVKIVYVALSVLIAGGAFIPAVCNDPDHAICKKD